MEDDDIAVICLTVDYMPFDPTSTRGHYCHKCATEVWMGARAVDFCREHPKVKILCAPCAMEDEPDEVCALPGDVVGASVAKHPKIMQILRVLYKRDDST